MTCVIAAGNAAQAELWNGAAGRAWVQTQALLDRMWLPFERILVERAAAAGARRVLDVGCGTGGTTLALAQALERARCVGVDLSLPMIELARARAAGAGAAAEFVCADAQSHPFARGAFDAVVSRFGVMFFADAVRAFANLRNAARDGARLCVLVWRSAAQNPFMTAAERAAAPLLRQLPARDPDAPGQFAFADPARVRQMLAHSGWDDVAIHPLDVECRFPAADLERYAQQLGPVGRVLAAQDEALRATVRAALRGAFASYVHGDEVRYEAACWRVEARAAR